MRAMDGRVVGDSRPASRMARCDSNLDLLGLHLSRVPFELNTEKIVPEELNESSTVVD